jgi:transposase
VVDRDSGRLVRAGIGRDKATLKEFFDLVGEERCAKIRPLSADGASRAGDMVAERANNATLRVEGFHVWRWASKALDEVRRQVWNEARKGAVSQHAKDLKDCRYAPWRNPEDLTARYEANLAWIVKVNSPLYRAYLTSEQLRIAIPTKGVLALCMLDEWLAWA